MVSKEIFEQYSDLQEEIASLRKRIHRLEEELAKMEEKGYSVTDSVRGGMGGTQNYKITGFPYEKYSKNKTLLFSRKAILETLEFDLLEMTNEVEEYIASVKDSKMRRILTMRFIDGLSQEEIGKKMNYERSNVSVLLKKFFEN